MGDGPSKGPLPGCRADHRVPECYVWKVLTLILLILLSASILFHPVCSIIAHIPGNNHAQKSCRDHSFLINLSSKEA